MVFDGVLTTKIGEMGMTFGKLEGDGDYWIWVYLWLVVGRRFLG